MLRKAGVQALRALLELAAAPQQWRSVNAIAAAQDLPAPMLEQLLLQLRRAQLVEARRGRLGGYRLQRHPREIAVGAVLQAVGAQPVLSQPALSPQPGRAEERVMLSLSRRLQQALDRELAALTLEELIYDLRSWQESLSNEGGLMLG
jgi:Rrf2 family iron-sulfur cluster assembly transcriptional regulator